MKRITNTGEAQRGVQDQGMATASFLRNRYWILRHGKSIPNEKGLIVSSIENGILPEYQLDPEGVEQARLAGIQFLKELKENSILLENVRICYSPFSRTIHTAKVAASVLNLPFEDPQCKMIENLRERYFGPSFELSSHEKYEDIWALDEEDPFKRPEGGESVEDVASRLAQAILEIESLFQGGKPWGSPTNFSGNDGIGRQARWINFF
ncbi:uncharacterized protein LOC103499109 isoform X2 [Cucumis melo]|uniref:Uncharacterized protein LOC103499109 isoform X2 n=1 Tax=Cucumis melo TaxID=3656 RepID=A0A9I9DRL5_CUCME|nr:uncharacterized protein LOC103499109 isoform X2 [Cucumis melo]